jgi:hypothetical protein
VGEEWGWGIGGGWGAVRIGEGGEFTENKKTEYACVYIVSQRLIGCDLIKFENSQISWL